MAAITRLSVIAIPGGIYSSFAKIPKSFYNYIAKTRTFAFIANTKTFNYTANTGTFDSIAGLEVVNYIANTKTFNFTAKIRT